MADWLLLLLLIALGAGGYWLMGRLDTFLERNFYKTAGRAGTARGWTFPAFCSIMGQTHAKEDHAHATDGQSSGAPRGCAG